MSAEPNRAPAQEDPPEAGGERDNGGAADAAPPKSATASAEADPPAADADEEADREGLLSVLDETSPPRSLSEEWQLTVAAVEQSDLRWLKLLLVELPHALRAIINFPSAVFANITRLLLMGTRVFLASRTKADSVTASAPPPAQEAPSQPHRPDVAEPQVEDPGILAPARPARQAAEPQDLNT